MHFAFCISLSSASLHAAPAERPDAPAATAPAALAPPDAAADLDFQVEQTRWRAVIDRAMDAYLFVGGGSGAIISADGYAITNNHVVASGRNWRVKTAAGRSYVADLVGRAPGTDLALLKLRDARNLPFLSLGDSDRLQVGQQVVAIGNPFALGSGDNIPTVTIGIVSAVAVNGPNVGEAVVTDTPINPGNSGGPLLNSDGELVGVNYGQMPSRFGLRINTGSGYAISSNQVRRFLDPLRSAGGGQVGVGAINGVKLETNAEGVVRVRQVEPDSPAAAAGLAVGDRIVALGPWPVVSLQQLLALATRLPAGSRASLTVIRRGPGRTELTIELQEQERVGLGVVLDRSSQSSLSVEQLIPGGPAQRAGIQVGDVIRAVGRIALPNRQALQALLARVPPGQRIPVTVVRGGAQVTLAVEVATISELQRLARQAAAPATQPDPPPPTATPATQPDEPSSAPRRPRA